MNFRHALGFFAMGAVFALMSRVAPSWIDSSSTRQIWLQIMSLVQMGLGLAYFARRTFVGLASLLEYTPRPAFAHRIPARAPQPVLLPRPTLASRSLAPITAALQNGLLDQRRAA